MRGPLLVAVATLALALAGAAIGCGDDGSPAAPSPTHTAANDGGGFVVCPPALAPSFDDLLTRVFSTSTCGTDNPHSCHSTSGSGPKGAGDLLDFTLDAGAVYAELVGHNATNISGDTPIVRVVPGDAGASMLYVKLTLTTASDPHYGAGMPLTAPGSVCPEALDAVRTWIEQGAKR